MKLINFNEFLSFKKMRENMGIPKDYKPKFESSEAILREIKFKEIKTKGLDISIDELCVASDKTLEHKDFPGQKMLVYIRDFSGDYVKDEKDMAYFPKFHLAWCSTLDGMHKSKKYDRYVVSQRNDGIFLLNKATNGRVVKKDIELPLLVCKNCLKALGYKSYGASQIISNQVFNNFTVKQFLDEYNTEIHIEPIHTSLDQPLNEYSKDWNNISYSYKKSKRFICQDCKKDCSKDTAELHVHHVDGVKSNNKASNLEVVCVKCHSQKPMHVHMLSNPSFKKYF
ncbi:HNH endonuclease [Cetobacterium sp.]|uniref:HNH endonuclease n=1 Tax=Cetobacterium sp. TaxID=2071632 RepID=UPI003F2D0208